MKKVIFLLATFVATLSACQQKGNSTTAAVEEKPMADSMVYVGEGPAADGPGIRYRLAMAKDSFTLDQTYLEAENGKDKTFRSVGKYEKLKTEKAGEICKLDLGQNEQPLYFKSLNDSTLRLVSEDFEESAVANTDLRLQK